ncbi:glutaredoxin family protein [Paenibacillus cremeus]|uniref:Thioredoxin n=1 Tax=Paenibacillus cremeus TaxID=2163881 RepID=A0A559KCM4_9BACL|nr:glutaredoxin domain-containing protein [Paenibacillus cremeus]TVY09839.1 thioredoxin [Paenibacillus cremeus]
MKLLKFQQPNCAPCTQVSEYLDNKNIKYEKINVWDDPEQASNYGIMSVPVVILLSSDGVEIRRSVGFKPQELNEFAEFFQQ